MSRSVVLYWVSCICIFLFICWSDSTSMNKKAQLSLTKPHDVKACQKLLQFDVKTNCRQVNDLFEVMEIRCLVIKFLIQITSTYSGKYYLVSFILNNITLITIVILVFLLSKHEKWSDIIVDCSSRQRHLASICQILRNFPTVRNASSRSSKVINLGANQKRIYTFLLATNINIGRISYRLHDIDAFSSKIACFTNPTLVWRPTAGERPAIST